MISKTIQKYLVILTLVGFIVVLGFLQYDLNRVEESLIQNEFARKEKAITNKLHQFFSRASEQVLLYESMGKYGKFDNINVEDFNEFFYPIMISNPKITSIIHAMESGKEIMLLNMGDTLLNRSTMPSSNKLSHNTYHWNNNKHDFKLSKLEEDVQLTYNPLTRPWYTGAVGHIPEIHWTSPYVFFTTGEIGITASKAWLGKDSMTNVLAFDILLDDICHFISKVEIEENGIAFLSLPSGKLLAFGKNYLEFSESSIGENELVDINKSSNPIINTIGKRWHNRHNFDEASILNFDGESWVYSFRPFNVQNLTLEIGLIAKKSDFEKKLSTSRTLMLGGQALVFIFMLNLIHGYRKHEKLNTMLNHRKKLLEEKNAQLAHQRDRMHHNLRNKVDSIKYAKRIQDAMLPGNALRKELFPQSFIFYRPKDLVSGDFYWFRKIGNKKIFAVADCTGHGVPGAMMSMLGHSFLEEIVGKKNITRPSLILNKLRNLIILALNQSDDSSQQDGMDISIIVYDTDKSEVAFAGANNHIYYFKKDELIKVNADKMSVGYEYRELLTYNTQLFKVNDGDMIYMFTDGYVDQLGGPEDRKYMHPKFRALLKSIYSLPMAGQYAIIENEFDNWKGNNEQIDDVCVVGIRINNSVDNAT